MKKRIIGIFILTIFIILNLTTQSLARLDIGDPDSWKPSDLGKSDTFEKKVGIILGGIRNCGIAVSVISLMIIGIRSMFGSMQEKADYKEALPAHIIGVVILLSCTTIPDFIFRIASTFNE